MQRQLVSQKWLRTLTRGAATAALVASGMALTGCDLVVSSGPYGTIDSVVDSDWDRDPFGGYDRPSVHDRAHERVGPGTGHHGCDMVVGHDGRIRSTCPGGRFAAQVPSLKSKLKRTDSAQQAEQEIRQLTVKYALPLESAEKLHNLLEDGKSGRVNVFAQLGLSDKLVRQMVLSGKLDREATEKLSQALALNAQMTEELVTRIAVETKAQMADVSSPAWQACQATGRWKTNANAGTCKSTAWTGCSPATGASFCAAVN